MFKRKESSISVGEIAQQVEDIREDYERRLESLEILESQLEIETRRNEALIVQAEELREANKVLHERLGQKELKTRILDDVKNLVVISNRLEEENQILKTLHLE